MMSGLLVQNNPQLEGYSFRFMLMLDPIGVNFSKRSSLSTSLQIKKRRIDKSDFFFGFKQFATISNTTTGRAYAEEENESYDVYFSHIVFSLFIGWGYDLF